MSAGGAALATGRVDELLTAFVEGGSAPGAAWGVVAGGELVHAGGAGTTAVDGGRLPDERSTFRIASLTKSFTAACVLALRDEGALRLDDPVAQHVPGLAGVRPHSADSPPLTVRHLLTMSGGLPTDDPWADRQESMDEAGLAALLRGGLRTTAAPGTAFAYSNLGFALLGRVVTSAAGREYREEVRSRLTEPLGLRDTAFAAEEADAQRLTRGYRRGPGGWEPVPFDRPGVFSAIGGLYSSVADLARWVAALAGAFPPRDDPDGPGDGVPLRRASRREMQQLHRLVPPDAADPAPGRPAGYGLGLFVEEHPSAGPIASHPGGYPGYGAHMRWSTELGIGVVVLANATYAPAGVAATAALEALLEGRTRPRPAPWPEVLAAQAAADRLVRDWDDALADRLFAVNADLDVPRAERRAQVRAAAQAVGVPPAAPTGPPAASHPTPAAATWEVAGTRGSLRVSLSLTPQVPPRVQALVVTAVPAPPPVPVPAPEEVPGAADAGVPPPAAG